MKLIPTRFSVRQNRGFTLLELLVVISIIGILIAMGTVAFATAQQKARDSKRRGDMQAMQKAFEQYFADNGAYAGCSTMAASPYMQGGLPDDPQPSKNYTTTCAATSYCLCANLEDTGSGNATNTACNFAATGDYYCVSNLQ